MSSALDLGAAEHTDSTRQNYIDTHSQNPELQFLPEPESEVPGRIQFTEEEEEQREVDCGMMFGTKTSSL